MEFTIKNIILYDVFGSVVGFAEFKIRHDRTDVKVRHNLPVRSSETNSGQLMFSIVANGEAVRTFAITGVQSLFEIRGKIDAEREIFIRISKLGSGEAETLASGVINQTKIITKDTLEKECHEDELPNVECCAVKNEAVRELDEALRSICIIDENGKGQCETCPYREHFFGAAVDEDEVVV